VVPPRDARHPGANLDHDPRPLVAEHRGEEPLRVGARERELVRVADAGRPDLYQHLALFRPLQLDGLDLQRFTSPECYSRLYVHRSPF
jgi:hypothetical protein